MATVRFSESLKEDIINKARQGFEAAVNKAVKGVPDPNVWFERVWFACFGKYETALAALPSGFLHTIESINLTEIETSNGPVRANIKLYNANKRPFPMGTAVSDAAWSEFGLIRTTTWGNDFKISARLHSENTTIQELTDICRNRTEAIHAAVQRRDEYVNMVKQVINSTATLAPALKMWPPLWDLLNQQVKDKHREVVARTPTAKREALSEEVDFDRLTALAAISKMGAQ